MRRRRHPPVRPDLPHRINEAIRIPRIQVIDAEGQSLGEMTPERGRLLAQEHGLDLVEVAPTARPPVCKLMDYGRFRYDQSKKQQAQKKQVVQLKTIQLRPKTDTHDLETKLKRAERFLEQGHRVRVLMRLRGRERGLVPRWLTQMQDLVDHFGDAIKVTAPPVAEGRGVAMTIEPA